MSGLELSKLLQGKKGERFWTAALQSTRFQTLLQDIVQQTGWQEANVPVKLAGLYGRLSEHIHSHKFPRSETAVLLVAGVHITEVECRSLEALARYFGVRVERGNVGW